MSFSAAHRQLQHRLGSDGNPTTVGQLRARFRQHDADCQGCGPQQALNQDLLTWLHAQGYLPTVPEVRHDHDTDRSSSCRVYPLSAAISVIWLRERQGLLNPLGTHGRADLAALPTQPALAHWRTLFHEAGHAVIATLDWPFRYPAWPQAIHDALHRTLLGPLAANRSYGFNLLEEAFADVYALMMLWRLAGPSQEVAQELATLMALRRANRQHDPLDDCHLTDPALELAWVGRDTWVHMAPDALIEAAQTYASAGWVALMDPAQDPHARARWGTVLTELGARSAQRQWAKVMAESFLDPAGSGWARWCADQPDHPFLRTLQRARHAAVCYAPRWPDESKREHRRRLEEDCFLVLDCQEVALKRAIEMDRQALHAFYGHTLAMHTDIAACAAPLADLPCPAARVRPAASPKRAPPAPTYSLWERIFLAMGQARY